MQGLFLNLVTHPVFCFAVLGDASIPCEQAVLDFMFAYSPLPAYFGSTVLSFGF